jgi:hypothetical protein
LIGIVPADVGKTKPSLIFLIHALWLHIYYTVHSVVGVVTVDIVIFWVEASHACPPTSASALTLVVSRERVAASESSPAFGASMWALASVQLGMSLQVV